MCRKPPPVTTAASPGTSASSGVPKPPALPAIKPLQQFLSAAYTANGPTIENVPNNIAGITLVTKKLAISIRAVFKDSTSGLYSTEHAQIPFDGSVNPPLAPQLMHYSGSLVKVAAIYAAFDLFAAAMTHAKAHTFTSNDDFLNSFDGTIDTSTAIQRLKDFGKGLKPALKKIFSYDSTAANPVKFIAAFQDGLTNIFHNEKATVVVDALGYSYINVSLMKSGFFDAATLTGIWLAGDYSKETSLKSVRVPTVNDAVPGGSAQNITSREMSRMFYIIHTGQAYPYIADATIRQTANDGAHAVIHAQLSFLDPNNGVNTITAVESFNIHCTKVGIGALGPVATPGAPVNSGGEILTWKSNTPIAAFNTKFQRNLTGEFAVVWQNVYQLGAKIDSLVTLINSTIENYLTQ